MDDLNEEIWDRIRHNQNQQVGVEYTTAAQDEVMLISHVGHYVGDIVTYMNGRRLRRIAPSWFAKIAAAEGLALDGYIFH